MPRWSGELRVRGDGAEELLGQLGVEAGDRHRRQLGVEAAERAPGDVDRALAERLVHRHHGVAVAADPGAVAERLVERLAERDADVLDRVVGAGLEVALGLDREPEAAVAAEQLEHVVEEADAGRGATSPPSRSSSRLILVSRVSRSIFAVLCSSVIAPQPSRVADSPCTGKPSASAIAATCGRQFSRRRRADGDDRACAA